jgi:hypothetical protein
MEQDKDEQYDVLISDAIRFLESLGNYYGAERAMDVWSAMGPAMGDDVKGQVFMTMLSDNHSSMRLQLSRTSHLYNGSGVAVPVIKCIRTHTGLGLKEAKDIWDSTAIRAVWIDCTTRSSAKNARDELISLGMRVR